MKNTLPSASSTKSLKDVCLLLEAASTSVCKVKKQSIPTACSRTFRNISNSAIKCRIANVLNVDVLESQLFTGNSVLCSYKDKSEMYMGIL